MSIMLFILLYGGCTLILMMIAAHLQSGYTIGVIMLVWLALGIGIIASQTQASTAAGSALLAKIIKRSLISLL